MLPTSKLVRRSVLLTPASDRAAVEACWRLNADVIALDLSETVPPSALKQARAGVRDDVIDAARGGSEVFVKVTPALAYADIKAAATPELAGIMVDLQTVDDVAEIDAILTKREREEGIPLGRLEIFASIDTALGVWNIHDLLAASQRITTVTLDETALSRDLSIMPDAELDAFQFARGRVIVETLGATRLPLGMTHPLSVLPREGSPDEMVALATRAFNTGLRGAVCVYPSSVAVCNEAFTPTPDQVSYYTEVRRLFAEGIARGTAAVPFPGGRMIDVPVDERAQLMLDLQKRCETRDAQKRAALAAAGASR